jgi:hypothetical protein
VITFDMILDVESLLAAEPTTRIAVALAYREHHDTNNSLSLRDEWARAFGRHALEYLSATRPN